MSNIEQTENQLFSKERGYFYTKKNSYNDGWSVLYTYQEDGKRKFETVKKLAHFELGFKDSMNIEEARSRAKQINKERSIEINKVRAAAKRVTARELETGASTESRITYVFV